MKDINDKLDDKLNSNKGKTALKKKLRISNKSDKPDNVVMKELQIEAECKEIEQLLPLFMRSFFSYLRSSLLPMSRLAYLQDIKFIIKYLVEATYFTNADDIKNINPAEMDKI